MFVPDDTFTSRTPLDNRSKAPHVIDGPEGPMWVAGLNDEHQLGPWGGHGNRTWSGLRGQRMREAGYSPEERRPANPDKRLEDLNRDQIETAFINKKTLLPDSIPILWISETEYEFE